jgi:hypothetical protein
MADDFLSVFAIKANLLKKSHTKALISGNSSHANKQVYSFS